MKYLVSLVLGLLVAAGLGGYRYVTASERAGQTTMMWGAAQVTQVQEAVRVLSLAAQTESLEWSYHKDPGNIYDHWRNVAVIVPVRVVLGFDASKVEVTSEGDRVSIALPPVDIVSLTVLHDPKSQIIWKDEGNAFKDVDWQSEVWEKGRENAKRKIETGGFRQLAQERAVAFVRDIAVAAGADPQNLQVIVRTDATNPEIMP